MAKIVLATQDVGNGNMLSLIEKKLKAQGHTVEIFLGGGKSMPEGTLDKISQALQGATWLIVSISSAKERVLEERYAITEAKRLGVRVAVMSDIYGMYQRLWITDLMPQADLVSVIDEQEIEAAREYAGENTKIVYAPNPCWADYFTAKFSREEIRQKLGIKRNEKLIGVAGTKELERNAPLYTDVIVAGLSLRYELRFVLTIHPGATYKEEAYQGILNYATHPTLFLRKETGFSTQDVIPGCDLVISGGGSTISVMAACLRVPVIDLMHPIDRLWWQQLSGLDYWPPVKKRASKLVADSQELKFAMATLLLDERRQAMIFDQEAAFPSPAQFADGAKTFIAALSL